MIKIKRVSNTQIHMSNIICKTFLISHDFSFITRTERDIKSSYEGGGVALSLDGFIFFLNPLAGKVPWGIII